MADLFTLLRQAAKDGSGYVNLPLVDKLEAEAKRKAQGMTDNQLLNILKAIKKMALVGYPFPDDQHGLDAVLLVALGQIAAVADAAIVTYQPLIRPAPHIEGPCYDRSDIPE